MVNLQLITVEENGKKSSPTLPPDINNYLIDIDGTICEDIPNEEPERMTSAVVSAGAVETINKWFDEGHIITFFTARTEKHREVTENWLTKNGFRFHNLIVDKPRGGNYYWVDNVPLQVMNLREDFWKSNFSKNNIFGFKAPADNILPH